MFDEKDREKVYQESEPANPQMTAPKDEMVLHV